MHLRSYQSPNNILRNLLLGNFGLESDVHFKDASDMLQISKSHALWMGARVACFCKLAGATL